MDPLLSPPIPLLNRFPHVHPGSLPAAISSMCVGGGSGGGGGSPRELGMGIGPRVLDGSISTGLVVRCGPLTRCKAMDGGEGPRVGSIFGDCCHELKR